MIGTDDFAETAVLASCIDSPVARKACKRVLDGEDFLNPSRADVYDAMGQLDRDKRPVDFFTVRDALAGNAGASQVLTSLFGHPAISDNAEHYAGIVRGWAVRRRLYSEATRVQQQAANPEVDIAGLTSAVASRFSTLRDAGSNEDAQSITLAELLQSPDDEPDWVIPDLIEKRDRLILTGGEGLGKSYLLRQIAIMAAAGLDPFFPNRSIKPAKVLIVDCENSLRQVKRKARPVVGFAQKYGTGNAGQVKRKARPVVGFAQKYGTGNAGQVNLMAVGRIDILRDKDLAMIHRELDVIRPDIIVIGPIYAMSPKALMTDDDAVPVLAALDTMREHGAALLMEAHAGHAMGVDGRNFRPRGSAALMGWPEFGYGMKPSASGYIDFVPWRGDRDARSWPKALRHARDGIRWEPHEDGKTLPETARWTPTSALNGAAS